MILWLCSSLVSADDAGASIKKKYVTGSAAIPTQFNKSRSTEKRGRLRRHTNVKSVSTRGLSSVLIQRVHHPPRANPRGPFAILFPAQGGRHCHLPKRLPHSVLLMLPHPSPLAPPLSSTRPVRNSRLTVLIHSMSNDPVNSVGPENSRNAAQTAFSAQTLGPWHPLQSTFPHELLLSLFPHLILLYNHSRSHNLWVPDC